MTKKHFISAQDLLEDSFRLGVRIINSGFRPDFIVGIWRGGTPVGIAIQELMEYYNIPTDHISLRTSFYAGVAKTRNQVRVHGLGYLVRNLNAHNALLIVDDVFDSGRSIDAVVKQLSARTRRNTPHQIKVATPWYKPGNNATSRVPDFYLYETDHWLVFPHEFTGLTEEELITGKGSLFPIVQSVSGS